MAPRSAAQLPPLLASLARRRGEAGGASEGSKGGDAEKGPVSERRADKAATLKPQKRKVNAKAEKGAPLEVSSRKPVAPRRNVKPKASQARDPRFDDFSGKLDMDLFRKTYTFLEDYRQEETETMKEKLDDIKRRREEGEEDDEEDWALQERLSAEVRKRVRTDKQRRHLAEMRAAELNLKREEREKVRTQGKTPYFHTRTDIRQRVEQQKNKGSRAKMEERRERKAASRDKKKIPRRRKQGGE
mmetsp:Transcript_92354/g.270341  ORF Transcript_92354/g.270341 Transcript_92354/m.270341 type:complete len:244 (+) Transcript_92354:41-772(+)